MKKTIIAIIIMIIVITNNTITIEKDNQNYQKEMKVYNVTNEVITLEAEDGNLWDIDYEEDLKVNDKVNVIMNDNATITIYDDEIIEINKR